MVRKLCFLCGVVLCLAPLTPATADESPDLDTVRDAINRGQWNLAAAELDIVLASSPPPDVEAEGRYLRAILHRDTGNVDAAIADLEVVARLGAPLRIDADALYLYGELLYETGQYARAGSAFRQFAAENPKDNRVTRAVWYEAESAAHSDSCDVASDLYDRVLAMPSPTEIRQRAHYGRGWCRRRGGDEGGARSDFATAAVGSDSTVSAQSRFEAGASAYRLRDYRDAIAWLEGRNGGPAAGEDDRREVILGQSYFALGAREQALPHLEKALELAPDDERPALLYQIGWVRLEEDDPGDALGYFTQLSDTPGLPDSLRVAADYGLGISLLRSDRLNEAIGPLERVRQSREAAWGAEARYALAWIYHQTGDFARSQAAIDELRRLYPESGLSEEAAVVHGENLFRAERYDEAVRAFNRRLEQGEGDEGDILFRLGVANLKLARYPDAESAFRELLLRHPGSPHRIDARFWLGEALYRQGRYDEALDAYRAVRIADPEGPRALDALYGVAWCDYSAGRYEEAAASFGLILEIPGGDRDGDATFRRGNCFYNLGRYPEAVRDYDRVVRLYPDSPLAPRALYQKAWALNRSEEFDHSAETFDELRQRYPEHDLGPTAVYWSAYALFRDGQYVDAADRFASVASMDAAPESLQTQSRLRMAESYFNAREYGRAASLYESLTGPVYGTPIRQAAYEGWIESLQAGGRSADAERVAQQMSQAFPDSETSGEALYRIGLAHLDARRWQDGMGALRKYLEIGTPEDHLVDANVRCAEASLELGDKLRAAEYYRNAAHHGDVQDGIDYRFEAGRIFYELGKYQLARDEFRRVARLKPETETRNLALYNLGLALKETGEGEAALANFEAVANDKSASPEVRVDALLEAGLLARDRGDGERAQQYLCEAGEKGKGAAGAEAQYWCAEGLFESGHYDDAIGAFRRVLGVFKSETEWGISARYRLAECFERLNRWTEAREQYQQIVSTSQDDTWVDDAQDRLDWIKDNPWVFEETPGGDPSRWGEG